MSVNINDSGSLRSGFSSVLTEEGRTDDLSDGELVALVELLTTNNHILALDNMVLESFFVKVDPVAAVGLKQLLDQAATAVAIHSRMQAATSMMVHGAPSGASLKEVSTDLMSSPRPSRMSYSTLKFGTTASITGDKGPRINVNQKMDMVLKLIDETRDDLETLRVKSQQSRINIHAALEESHLMLEELKETEVALEAHVVRKVDKLTGRIPAERFVRHMEDWLQKADMTIEKLRLRASTLRSQNIRIQQLLVEKEELGERIHPVDFVQLQIENKDLIEKLEQKNFHLIELKKVTGRSALMLTNHKKQLMQQVNTLAQLRSTVAERDAQMLGFLKEGNKVENELEKAEESHESMRELMSKYTVPKLFEYITKKAELYELRKTVKIWTRRQKIQQTALKDCHGALRRMSGESRTQLRENVSPDASKSSTTSFSKNTSIRWSGSKSNVMDLF